MSIHNKEAILLDLDGLLVDTEAFHHRAYQSMCESFGCILSWDFDQYYHISGSSSGKVQEELYKLFPHLFKTYTWAQLYARKQEFLHEFIEKEPIPLMPFVEEAFLMMVQTALPIVVVTNSSSRCVARIREEHSLFSPVSFWVSREQYKEPKPSPECYLKALCHLKVSPTKAIGFEDSYRGVCALKAAGCQAVLINSKDMQAQEACRKMKIEVYATLESVPTVLLSRRKKYRLCG
jgi:beta-phosphoglucomutase